MQATVTEGKLYAKNDVGKKGGVSKICFHLVFLVVSSMCFGVCFGSIS